MFKKLLTFIVIAVLLSVTTLAVSVGILPVYPLNNDDLSCYVNGVLCEPNSGCNSHWYVNNHQVLINKILPSSYTNVGDSIKCTAWIFGNNVGSDSTIIYGVSPINTPPVIGDIPDVIMPENTVRTINLNNYASDADGDTLTWTVSGNTNINVNIINGIATITPNQNWNGQETLTFTVSDGRGGFAFDNVLVTVTQVDNPIGLNDIPNIIMDENTVYTLNLTPYIIDTDGDLQDIIVSGNNNINVNINFQSRTLTLTPAQHWFGQELLTVQVIDFSTSAVDQFRVTVNQVNHPPVIQTFTPAQTDVNIYEGDNLLFSVTANDPEGILLTYRWSLDNIDVGTGATYLYHAADGPANHDLEVFISDGINTISNTWYITEVNVAPIADANGPYFCTQNNNIILRGTGIDPGIFDTLVYNWDLNNDGIYESTGQAITINCGNLGTFPIRLRITDKDGGIGIDSTILTVTTTPTNNQPYFDPHLTNQDAIANQIFTYDINAYDADPSDVLTYTDNSPLFTINPNTGIISFIPTIIGAIPVAVTICDNQAMPNSCTTENFNIFVSLTGNNAPIVQITSPANGANFAAGASITFSGTGADIEDGSLIGNSLVWTSSIDGLIGTGNSFTRILSQGTHIITLTGTDSGGAADTDIISIIVSVVSSQAPVAIAGNDIITTRNTIVHFNGSASYDPDGIIISYYWTFGDGTSYSHIDTSGINPREILAQHSYSAVGNYTVTLTITDNSGLTGTDTLVVNVRSSGIPGTSGLSTAYINSINDKHEFVIKNFKVMGETNAGQDIKLFVEIENTGSYDETVNLKLKSDKLLLVRNFGDYEVAEGESKLIYLIFTLDKDASGKYVLELEASNDNYKTSKILEIDTTERAGFINVLTGAAAGYNIEIEKESGVWIWLILVLILIVLISLGIWKIYKDE